MLHTFYPCKWLDILVCSKDSLTADLSDHVSYGGCRSLYRPISRLTVDRHIGRYVGRESVDITAEWCLPVGRDRSTDRPTVGLDIIVSVSAMYRGIVGRVSVRYQWIIGIA